MFDNIQQSSPDSECTKVHSVPTHSTHPSVRVLRIADVIARTGLSRATLYNLIASDQTFPSKVQLAARAVGFLESEINAWIVARITPHRVAK